MSGVASVGRVAGLSVLTTVAVLLTLAELPVAIVVATVGGTHIWPSGAVGLAYIGLVSVVVFKVATRRTSFANAALQLLAIDIAALPFVVFALSM